jgi:DNA-directed RNA polymerase subunit L
VKYKVVSNKKDELKFELRGEDHTFSALLVDKLLDDKSVDIAQYNIPHPLIGEPVFYIKTKKGKPEAALKKALADLKKDVKKLQKK